MKNAGEWQSPAGGYQFALFVLNCLSRFAATIDPPSVKKLCYSGHLASRISGEVLWTCRRKPQLRLAGALLAPMSFGLPNGTFHR